MEHVRAPSPIYQCSYATGHHISVDVLSIVGREVHGVEWTIKEAMFMRLNDPSCTRFPEKYQLLYIWDEVLQDTLALHLR